MPGKFMEGCRPDGTKFIFAELPDSGKVIYQIRKPESFEVKVKKK